MIRISQLRDMKYDIHESSERRKKPADQCTRRAIQSSSDKEFMSSITTQYSLHKLKLVLLIKFETQTQIEWLYETK